jgi:hypothetical protein
VFGLGSVVDEEGVQWESVWEDEVADVVSADGEAVEAGWVSVAHCHFDGFEECVHLHVDACTSVRSGEWNKKENEPVIVPWTTAPFLSSMVTVSLFNFIKNLLESISFAHGNEERNQVLR